MTATIFFYILIEIIFFNEPLIAYFDARKISKLKKL